MQEPRHTYGRVVGLALALLVALGLLSMHGLDAHATADGHGLTAAPSALASHTAPAAASNDEPVVPARSQPRHSMAGLCLAVLAAGLVLLAGVISIARIRFAGARQERTSWIGAVATPWSDRAPPSPPRIALCVSLS